jgi:hypothetical protein
MLRVTAGTEVKLAVPFEDENGTPFVPTAAAWTLLDENEAQIASDTISSIDDSAVELDVTIAGAFNVISAIRGARCLRVAFTAASGTITVDTHYIISKADTLTLLLNSFQTYGQSLVRRESIGGMLQGWDMATARDRSSAMEGAFTKLARMAYRVAAQDPRNYASFEDDDIGCSPAWIVVDIASMPTQDFLGLPSNFREALARAQILEADNILGGDVIGARRQDGVLSETTGESSMMFNSRPALDRPVCKAAYREVGAYVYRRIEIARG